MSLRCEFSALLVDAPACTGAKVANTPGEEPLSGDTQSQLTPRTLRRGRAFWAELLTLSVEQCTFG
jgi:hypothetical protein